MASILTSRMGGTGLTLIGIGLLTFAVNEYLDRSHTSKMAGYQTAEVQVIGYENRCRVNYTRRERDLRTAWKSCPEAQKELTGIFVVRKSLEEEQFARIGFTLANGSPFRKHVAPDTLPAAKKTPGSQFAIVYNPNDPGTFFRPVNAKRGRFALPTNGGEWIDFAKLNVPLLLGAIGFLLLCFGAMSAPADPPPSTFDPRGRLKARQNEAAAGP